MQTLTRRARRLAAATAGLAIACALTAPAAAAHAAVSGYSPSSTEWWFSNWGVQQDVWPVTQGAGVTVAVVDSGVQASVPDLRGVVEPGADELGDPGSGQQDYAASTNGHGTGVAVMIAGQGTGTGTVGIAPQAKILPVHVIFPNTNSTAPIAQGIRYAVNHGAGVINLSVGAPVPSPTSCDPELQQAVAYALAHNVVVVVASGDANLHGTSPEQPATCAGVLTVGGVEQNGALWQGSVQGSNVDVAAPGDHMVDVGRDGRYTVNASGTSLAAPLVSGAAALIRSAYPSMPWYTVDQRLIDTAVHVGSVPNDGTGYGIININRALHVSRYPVSASAPNPPYARYQAWLKANGQSGNGGGQAAPSATARSSSGSSLLLIAGIVVIVVVVALVLLLTLTSRGRSRRGQQYPPPRQ